MTVPHILRLHAAQPQPEAVVVEPARRVADTAGRGGHTLMMVPPPRHTTSCLSYSVLACSRPGLVR